MIGAEGAAPERPTRRVRPWIAALLSLLAPGLGHFYAGRTRRALWWILAWAAFYGITTLGLHFFEDAAWLALLPALVLLAVAQLTDAFLTANGRRAVQRGAPLRLLGYVAVYAIGIGLQLAAGEMLPVRSFYIPSGSMIPTLEVDDRVLVRMFSPLCRPAPFRRGDVVLVREAGATEFLMRRVVAISGDNVRLDDQGLEVNGVRATGPIERTFEAVTIRGETVSYGAAQERLDEAQSWTVHATSGAWGEPFEGIVPEGHVFSLGDNRASSNDDRFRGPTRVDEVAGRALRVPFSLTGGRLSFPWRNLRVNSGPSCASS